MIGKFHICQFQCFIKLLYWHLCYHSIRGKEIYTRKKKESILFAALPANEKKSTNNKTQNTVFYLLLLSTLLLAFSLSVCDSWPRIHLYDKQFTLMLSASHRHRLPDHTQTQRENKAKICRDEEQLELKHDSVCSLSLFIEQQCIWTEQFSRNGHTAVKAVITLLTSALDFITGTWSLLLERAVNASPSDSALYNMRRYLHFYECIKISRMNRCGQGCINWCKDISDLQKGKQERVWMKIIKVSWFALVWAVTHRQAQLVIAGNVCTLSQATDS